MEHPASRDAPHHRKPSHARPQARHIVHNASRARMPPTLDYHCTYKCAPYRGLSCFKMTDPRNGSLSSRLAAVHPSVDTRYLRGVGGAAWGGGGGWNGRCARTGGRIDHPPGQEGEGGLHRAGGGRHRRVGRISERCTVTLPLLHVLHPVLPIPRCPHALPLCLVEQGGEHFRIRADVQHSTVVLGERFDVRSRAWHAGAVPQENVQGMKGRVVCAEHREPVAIGIGKSGPSLIGKSYWNAHCTSLGARPPHLLTLLSARGPSSQCLRPSPPPCPHTPSKCDTLLILPGSPVRKVGVANESVDTVLTAASKKGRGGGRRRRGRVGVSTDESVDSQPGTGRGRERRESLVIRPVCILRLQDGI